MNILYIYGYKGSFNGSTVTKLRTLTKDHNIFSFEYNQNNCEIARQEIIQFIKENNIDLVIGSSLGGFITLTLHGYNRFVINPCMKPSIELPKLGCSQKITDTYTKFEEYLDNVDIEERVLVVGFFGIQDELFGNKYWDKFKKEFKNIEFVNSGHHASEQCLNDIINYIPKYINKANRI